MLDVRLIRRAGIARRGDDPAVIDEVHALDAELRGLAAKRDSLRAEIRVLSNEVGKLFREQRKDDATELQEQSRLLGAEEKALDHRAEELQTELR
jgi:seryl-tRNA synthetase